MVEVTRTQIEKACHYAGLDTDSDIRWEYEGRGAFGESCLGIICELDDLLEIVTDLARQDDQLDLVWLRRVRGDSMGYNRIWYFPGFSLDAEEEE